MKSPEDRGESISLMEPMQIGASSRHQRNLTDLVITLVEKSASLQSSLPPGLASALSNLVRAMNCYYSNLIEGHDTHPVDIERALKNDYSTNPEQRNLQLEAKAHISVQTWIDHGNLANRQLSITGLCELHKRFYDELPDELLWAMDPETNKKIKVEPGTLRKQDVKVGSHVAISPGAIPRFLSRFEEAYNHLGKVDLIMSAATAHHRLLWIHPFLDGNGRVARLMSHGILLQGLGNNSIWSISRGLARNNQTYKSHLAACDMTRRNDLDGRGHLSEKALANFIEFFLETCIDQVEFMESLVQPTQLRQRILRWAMEEIQNNQLPSHSNTVLRELLYRGELHRGEIAELLGTSDRQARRVTSALMDRNILHGEGHRAPLFLNFPAELAPRWLPGLFPEK